MPRIAFQSSVAMKSSSNPSFRSLIHVLTLPILLVALAGCGQEDPAAEGPPTPDAPEAAGAPPADEPAAGEDTIDVAIAIDHMTLAAVEEGLGTCWIGAFFAAQAREILGIPENVPVVELLTLGYPTSIPGPSSRLPFDKIIKYERWSD